MQNLFDFLDNSRGNRINQKSSHKLQENAHPFALHCYGEVDDHVENEPFSFSISIRLPIEYLICLSEENQISNKLLRGWLGRTSFRHM